MICLNPKIAYQRPYRLVSDKLLSTRNQKRLNKISFAYKKGWIQVQIPCGECPCCRLAKANEWATRIECEAREHNHMGVFVTLTYNNPNLPLNANGIPTLKKIDMQNFKKRLRKYLANKPYLTCNQNGKIRTFECGEYGPKTHRPHYHQIIFNYIPSDLKFKELDKRGFPLYTSKELQKIWGNGFVIIGTISWQSASYVARYTMKKQSLAKIKRKYYDALCTDEETGELYMTKKWHNIKGEIEPEFITMSTKSGIGATYFKNHFAEIKKNNGILINVDGQTKLKSIPRYFKKLWERWNWEDYHNWRYKYTCQMQEYVKNKIQKYNLGNIPFWKKLFIIEDKEKELIKYKFNLLSRDNILYDGNLQTHSATAQ